MPELPEVETVRRGLAARVVGRTIADVEVLHPRGVRRQAGGAARARRPHPRPHRHRRRAARQVPVAHPRRRTPPTPPDEALLAHLGMSGQLLVQEPEEARQEGVGAPPTPPPSARGTPGGAASSPRRGERPADLTALRPPTLVRTIPATTAHLRVRLRFADGGQLWFVDQRTFGHLMAVDTVPTDDGAPGGHGTDAPVLPAPVAHIARDLLDPSLDRVALVRRIRARRTEVKRALLDQSLVSGVGNIYADEALWRARLHGTRATDRLRPARLGELFDAAADVMREALAVGGTSFDALYVDVEGAAGLLRPLARRLRPRRAAVPALRRTGAPRAVHEPRVVLLPALPAPPRRPLTHARPLAHARRPDARAL